MSNKPSTKVDICVGLFVYLAFSIVYGIFSLNESFYGN